MYLYRITNCQLKCPAKGSSDLILGAAQVNMKINFRNSLDYARQYSHPRRVGTAQEVSAAEQISNQLQQLGYAVELQVFQFVMAFERVLTAEIFIGLLLVTCILLTYGFNQWVTLLLTGMLVILMLVIGPVNRFVQKHSIQSGGQTNSTSWPALFWPFGKPYSTKNIAATWPGSQQESNLPHLYLVAHYDSKSQYLPLVLRIGLFVVVIAGSLVFSALVVLDPVLASLKLPVLATGCLVIIAGIPLLFLDYGNDSTGAIDNASGVGLVLYLAEILAGNPEVFDKVNVALLITSAEELALKGAHAYLQHNQEKLQRMAAGAGLQVLNFDGIGVDGKLHLVGSGTKENQAGGIGLSHLVRQCGLELGIPIGGFRLPGALFDHIPFTEAGLDAISVIGIGKDSLSVHTRGDSAEKLCVGGFEKAGRLAIRVIEKLSGEALFHEKN